MSNELKGGPWRPGQSGNPAGRKPGTGQVSALRAQIGKRLPSIIEKVIAAAEGGDMQAARLLIERVIPSVRGSAEPVALPAASGSLSERATSILDAVNAGRLPPDVGAQLVAAVAAMARVYETEELERRIAALEKVT